MNNRIKTVFIFMASFCSLCTSCQKREIFLGTYSYRQGNEIVQRITFYINNNCKMITYLSDETVKNEFFTWELERKIAGEEIAFTCNLFGKKEDKRTIQFHYYPEERELFDYYENQSEYGKRHFFKE